MPVAPDRSYVPSMTTPAPAPPAPPEILLGLSSAHVDARALHLVAELGVADHLGDASTAVDELARAVGVRADALHRLLRLLESHGIFERDGSGRWQHTETSRWLRTDHPTSMRAFARMSASSFSWGAVTHLDHAARTGEAGICRLDPGGWMAYLETHPHDSEIFQGAMAAKAHADVAAALDAYDFSRHRRIADIGGGHGHLIRAVLDAHPAVEGVLFDLPAVTAGVEQRDRLDIVAGDFFEDPLPACDCYVLMNIIHDWHDEAATSILRAVAEAGAEQAATVLLIEVVMPDGAQRHWAKTLDVMMLAITGGRERTLPQYRDLLAAAGADLISLTPTATPFSIIEAKSAGR